MSRPLVITDCDEVLLHMVMHFRDWLDEAHDIELNLAGRTFANAMRRRGNETPLEQAEIWTLLDGFFDDEMHRQTPIPGAVEAVATLGEQADVVVLTNLSDHRRDDRVRQLASHGIEARVFTNLGPKGPAIRQIIAEYRPSRAIFIDDLAQHHESAAGEVPEITRLHLVGEPSIADFIPCALEQGHAHARIDNWAEALPWLHERLHEAQR